MKKEKLNILCPSGFPEFGPAEERVRQEWIKIISDVFSRNGFMRIDTPLVEREENLLAKGGNPKEMYVLKRILDEDGDASHSGNAIRFDHTVPLALYVARHFNEITFPFKRQAIGPVMRGERAQKGRFRQFDQCDIDVIGSETLSLLNDAQMPSIIIQIFEKLNIGDFVVRINNRKILTGFFESLGIPVSEAKEMLRIVDELEKQGLEKIKQEFKTAGITSDVVQKIFDFTAIRGTNDEILTKLKKVSDNARFQEGISELSEVWHALQAMDMGEKIQIDLRIARGLDYYTGTVFETNLLDEKGNKNTSLGSICSGGRYDDLAEIFTGKKLPGVGISIGLTRLLSQLFEKKILKPTRSSPTEVLVLAMDESLIPQALRLGEMIREAGIATENYLEPKKVQKQFAYADKMGIPFCVIIGQDEVARDVVQLKNMQTGAQEEVKNDDLLAKLNSLI